jgi:hypothetical protein
MPCTACPWAAAELYCLDRRLPVLGLVVLRLLLPHPSLLLLQSPLTAAS